MRLSLCLDPGRPWDDVARLARLADDGGWHAVYVCYHFMSYTDDDRPSSGPMLECWTTLSALAGVTDRVRLGPLVLGNTYRHPAVVANMAATLDQVSHGRVVLGLGAGWQRNEHDAYGIALPQPAERASRFDEACTVVRALLDDEHVTFRGDHYHLDDAGCEPKPVQTHLPFLVGGTGPRMLEVTARHADVWHSWADVDELRERNTRLDAACERMGRDPRSLSRATGGTVHLTSLGTVPDAEPGDLMGDVEAVTLALHDLAGAGADEFIVVDDAGSHGLEQAMDLVSAIDEAVRPLV